MKRVLLIFALLISCAFLFTLVAQEEFDLIPNEGSDPTPEKEQTNNICNSNGVCDVGETVMECPDECLQADFLVDGGIPPFDGK